MSGQGLYLFVFISYIIVVTDKNNIQIVLYRKIRARNAANYFGLLSFDSKCLFNREMQYFIIPSIIIVKCYCHRSVFLSSLTYTISRVYFSSQNRSKRSEV